MELTKAMFFLAAVVGFSMANTVKFQDCGSKMATLNSIDVSPCVGAPYGCKLVKGTSPKLTITFTPNHNTANVSAVVHGIVSGVPVPFPLPNPNGCVNSGLNCPLKATKKVSYEASLPIKSIYPTLNVLIQWQLKDSDGEDLVCFRIRAKITDPSN